jgi:EAL domain-containing protein (putative c-di-GMP-specific phosphodiesterase class I)
VTPQDLREFLAPLSLVVQPVCDLRTGQLVAVEVLARIVGDGSATVNPREYWRTAAAVDPALPQALDHHVWATALAYLPRLDATTRLLVNLAPATFNPAAWTLWTDPSVPLPRLGCEVPRPALCPPELWPLLAAFRRQGGLVCWDASEPADMLDPPMKPDVVKIPRSWSDGIAIAPPFVQGQVIDWMDRVHAWGGRVVALGVDNPADGDWFAAHGADWGQGYLWGEPAGISRYSAVDDPFHAFEEGLP